MLGSKILWPEIIRSQFYYFISKLGKKNGATAFSITTLSIILLESEGYYADCHLCCETFMLSVTNKPFMQSVVILNVVMLSVMMLNIMAPK